MTKLKDISNPKNLVQPGSGCAGITDEDAPACMIPEKGSSSSACGCSSAMEETGGSTNLTPAPKQKTLSGKIRSGLLFGVACFTSPCCTPLYVPLLLVLLAGTPAAVWLSANIGWVYGILTVVSIISFVLALRWRPRLSGLGRSVTAVFKSKSLSKTNYSLEK